MHLFIDPINIRAAYNENINNIIATYSSAVCTSISIDHDTKKYHSTMVVAISHILDFHF
jgi:hypothetical protein